MTLKLLTPVRLGALELKNRVVMAPLTRCRCDNPGFVPTGMMARYYALRAAAGLIVSEGTIVSPQGRGYPFTPGIWSDEQVAGWRQVTGAVHEHGGLIVCQLWHCGRLSLPEFHGGQPPVAPSAINPNWKMFSTTGQPDTVTPHALTREEIASVVADFQHGAANAMAAGFDGVEIHSSNGYLFHQFFSRDANTRDDEYGGSHENRARFFREVLEAVGEVMPFDRLGFRLNPMMNRFHGLKVDEDTVSMWEHVVARANAYGLAFLHLSEPFLPRQLDDTPHGLADVGAHFRPLAKMPIVTNGGLDRDAGEARLQAGLCDAVAYGRAWIANPDLVERFARGTALNVPDMATFYTGGEKGYLDYPTLSD
ncbi:MAG TPA: alkene reductase [Accumulibacter sp.]|nr:alkene reductase [Accumulibacter sp.]HMW17389.1 alkene reductase [Accumulibacter sp.]HMX23340.1 alkene reductase [Accumulibacter sp.]HNC19095.1 alkene reductase [Accumulibacter sp.]HND80881.1 alkene reductase [Accumulibacter sp.]